MGQGYWILIWDGWGQGLVRINPRIYYDGTDIYGNPQNWWYYESITNEEIIDRHNLNRFKHFEIFRR